MCICIYDIDLNYSTKLPHRGWGCNSINKLSLLSTLAGGTDRNQTYAVTSVLGRRRKEAGGGSGAHHPWLPSKFKVRMSYVRPCLKNQQEKQAGAGSYTIVVTASQEEETEVQWLADCTRSNKPNNLMGTQVSRF